MTTPSATITVENDAGARRVNVIAGFRRDGSNTVRLVTTGEDTPGLFITYRVRCSELLWAGAVHASTAGELTSTESGGVLWYKNKAVTALTDTELAGFANRTYQLTGVDTE